jgi:hypothetical protein
MTSFSVYADEVCVVTINPSKSTWASIHNCKKNSVLDILVMNPYYPEGGVANFVTRLIANFCDYNQSIVVDKNNAKIVVDKNNTKDVKYVSFTCIKRN